MKYCKRCKITATESDAVCPKCKTPLSTFGSAAPADAARPPGPATAARPEPAPSPKASAGASNVAAIGRPALNAQPMIGQASAAAAATAAPRAPTFTLAGRIAELEQAKRQNLVRGRALSVVSLLVGLALLILLYAVYSRTVLAYAIIENIKFEQDDVAENQITVSFDVKTPGQVAFDRQSGTGHTEKLDLISTVGPHRMVWSWPSDPKTGIDFRVVSRGGWFLARTDQHFKITRKEVGVEIVFLMDVTSSMQPYIDKLKEKCINFADQIRRDGIDCRLGLVGFGDVEYNEPITVFNPNADPRDFQEAVARLELTDGGDSDESGVEAIEKALELEFRPHTRICFIHITDAGCHHEERIAGLAASLRENKVVTYVISQRGLRRLYGPLCVNGGSFYGITDALFASILKDVAKSITDQINSN